GRFLAAAGPAAPAAVIGCIGAVAVAIAASPLLPVGLARRTEPHLGVHVDTLALLAGAGLLLLATLAAVAWPAWRLSRQRSVGAAPSTSARPSIANRLARTGTPSLAVGVGMATRRGRGPSEVAVRTALVGILLGVIGVAATVVFSSSLQRLLDTPSRYGWVWDVSATADADTVARRPDTAAVADAVLEQTVQIGGRSAFAFGIDVKKGHVPAPVTRGRGPAAAAGGAPGPRPG